MQRLNFTIEIDAPKEKVWQTLWNDETYRQWTTAFCEGSYYTGDLQEGGRIHFLAPDGQGMFSNVEKIAKNEFISFRHIGELKDKAELPLTDETKKWSGCHENYSLTESNGKTALTVDIDAIDVYADFFNQKMPIALENVKNLAETKANAAL